MSCSLCSHTCGCIQEFWGLERSVLSEQLIQVEKTGTSYIQGSPKRTNKQKKYIGVKVKDNFYLE